mgnify:CR=1 FL=1
MKTRPLQGPISVTRDPTRPFDSMVSPYDIPEAVRVLKAGKSKFQIDFRYIDGPEPEGEVLKEYDGIELVLGKFTHRIVAIRVDINVLSSNIIQAQGRGSVLGVDCENANIMHTIHYGVGSVLKQFSARPDLGTGSGRIQYVQGAYNDRSDDIGRWMLRGSPDCSGVDH